MLKLVEKVSLYKHPRTFHLPWSPVKSKDDKTLMNADGFIGKDVVVTEKYDGENFSLYRDCLHARSLDYSYHKSRDLIKSLWAEKRFFIPENHRICGEYLYAQHSIHYDNLASYFLAHSVWGKDICLSWENTMFLLTDIGISCVDILYYGKWNEDLIRSVKLNQNSEGYVVRIKESFNYSDYGRNVAKCVLRPVETDEHWMKKQIIKNGLSPQTTVKWR